MYLDSNSYCKHRIESLKTVSHHRRSQVGGLDQVQIQDDPFLCTWGTSYELVVLPHKFGYIQTNDSIHSIHLSKSIANIYFLGTENRWKCIINWKKILNLKFWLKKLLTAVSSRFTLFRHCQIWTWPCSKSRIQNVSTSRRDAGATGCITSRPFSPFTHLAGSLKNKNTNFNGKH